MIAALAISLSGCASFQGAWTNIKSDLGSSGKVTTPAQMSKAVYVFDEPMDVQPIEEDIIVPNLIMPGQVTDIALERGESLTSVSAGDTIRWIVGDTLSGQGASEQVHVLVKPTAPNLTTNLVITTTKRTYYLELHSYRDTYMAAVSWRYPRQSIVKKYRKPTEKSTKASTAQTDIRPRLENLRFDYVIKGDTPKWRPVRVFDDGHKVFIQFPKNFARSEAPPLFITGKKGKGQLVNYRIKGDYYVVDRLFDAAELRIGEKNQTIVRIEREDKRS